MSNAARILDGGPIEDVRRQGQVVVTGGPVPILLVADGDSFRAIDNRCPHMGFPLHRGTVEDGILTCHWHHARFDLTSGCTFDLFADDVDTYPVEVRDGHAFVDLSVPSRDPVEHGLRRLEEGMDQNIRLVIAKAVVGLLSAGAEPNQVASAGGLYGVRRRRAGWGPGLTILSAMANVTDHLEGDQRLAPLYQGLLHVAADASGQPPKIPLRPLESRAIPYQVLRRWFRQLIEVRNADGAERALRAAIALPATRAQLADMMVAAATDHYYLAGWHVLDFINKAFELLDRVGWEEAGDVLSSLVRQLSSAPRSEELNSWRSPINLVALVDEATDSLADLLKEGEAKEWKRDPEFVEQLLQDDPDAIVAALNQALRGGGRPVELAASVAQAAALRIARFHVQNEFSDWIAVLHTFSYANALHQMLKRVESVEALRGVYHGAMRVYLDRFLNIPPARLPVGGEPADAATLLDQFLPLLDHQQQVDEAGRTAYRYLEAGGEPAALFRVLAEALLREDAEFHSFQMLEAALRQYHEREDEEERRVLLVAAARYLAAKAPTPRSTQQVLRIAQRLHRGELVFEEE